MDLATANSGGPDKKWLEKAIKENATRTNMAVRTRMESFRLMVRSKRPFLSEVVEKKEKESE